MNDFDIKIDWISECPMIDVCNIRFESMSEIQHDQFSEILDDLFVKFGDPSCTITWSGAPIKISAADDASCMIFDFIVLANWLMRPNCELEFSLGVEGFVAISKVELLNQKVKFLTEWIEFPSYLGTVPESEFVVDRILLTESIKEFLLEIENMLYLNGFYYFPLSFVCRYV